MTPSHSLYPFTDLTGKPVCVVRDEFSLAPVLQTALSSHYLMGMPTISVPIGDPQSNRDPRLSSGEYMSHRPSALGLSLSPRAVPLGRVPEKEWAFGHRLVGSSEVL